MNDKVKVSDLIIDFFERKGISTIFLLSGGMMMHLLDSLGRSNKIKYVTNHHEQASCYSAEAYARVKDKVGVCFATSGPGATNTITGITSAWVDSTPLMVLTGQSRTSLTARGMGNRKIRMVGNFEVDIVEIVKPITKYSYFIDNPKSILYHLEKAYIHATTGRPGPILLDIPLDIQSTMILKNELLQYFPAKQLKHFNRNFQEVEHLLNLSKRPVILAGHGIQVSKSGLVFRKMIEKLKIPVITTQLGGGNLEYEHEMYVGKVGLRGDRAGNHAIQEADLIITLGTSLHVTTTGYNLEDFATKAKLINVDLDENNLSKNKSVSDLQIKMDIKEFIIKILGFNIILAIDNWRQKLAQWKLDFQIINEPHKIIKDKINTYLLVNFLSEIAGEEDIITYDSGSLYYIMGQAFKSKRKQKIIASGGLGAMGYALPASIGVAFAEPKKNVICILGDGSLHTNIQELSVIAKHKLNIKIIAINNDGYASIRNTQNAFMDGNLVASSNETGVSFPEWGKLCESYLIPHTKISKFSNLKNILAQELDEFGTKFFEIIIPPEVELIPSVVSVKNEDGSFKSSKLDEMSPKIK